MDELDPRLNALWESLLLTPATPVDAVGRDIIAILSHAVLTDAEIEELLGRLFHAFRELRNNPNWISQ